MPSRVVIDCISDTHTRHKWLKFERPSYLEPGDTWILVHAGDFSFHGKPHEIEGFRDWLLQLPHDHKVIIAGNHELTFDAVVTGDTPPVDGAAFFRGAAHYLQETSIELAGLKFWGSPYSLRFFDWAFQADFGDDSKMRWSKCPIDADVMITHGPPRGFGDLCDDYYDRDRKIAVGSLHLLDRIKKVQPMLYVCGHIHQGRGVRYDEDIHTCMVNAAVLNQQYQPWWGFFRVELQTDPKKYVDYEYVKVNR